MIIENKDSRVCLKLEFDSIDTNPNNPLSKVKT